jgi:small-conductance mechanosensitive channel
MMCGRVVEINWRSVRLMTVNGLLIVANSSLAGGTFPNITKGDGPFNNEIYLRFASPKTRA